ncbi:FadR/GntR family transcriptional regulator [Arthrobacter sp.]|uniref:FadR/GntR family transcriptional regulator n=1 Tax=Arthrobacter sp. TaxID=1667 RepID=UPI003A926765
MSVPDQDPGEGKNAPAGGADESPIGGPVLAGIERITAMDAVRTRIAMAISLGLLQPGERLPDQHEVALGLSVSAITARRALTSLAEDGIVVRRRGRHGGTFVADHPPAQALRALAVGPADFAAIHQLVDRRLMFECTVTHFAALTATGSQLAELEELTATMAASTTWAEYHQADEHFHRLVGTASGLDGPTEQYHRTLAELYAYFLPYPITELHVANADHVELVAALREKDVVTAVDISRRHVQVLHQTMFMGLIEAT